MNPRLFPSLQKLSFDRLIDIYGIETVAGVINADEVANPGTLLTVTDISEKLINVTGISGACKHLLVKKLQELANPIVLAIVQGDLNQTEALIKEGSLLSLYVKGEAVDYSRRIIKNLTPFQAALCAWDDEMCEMLKKYMSDDEVNSPVSRSFPYRSRTAF